MLNEKTLKEAKAECKRFLKKVEELENRAKKDKFFREWWGHGITGYHETAAVKRASMDLSQALVALRRGKEAGN